MAAGGYMMAKHYSVYEPRTDKPIMIYGTSVECAKALGITLGSFYRGIVRQRKGKKSTKYEIFEDTEDDGVELEAGI